MKSLKDFILEAKKLAPEHQALVDVYEELVKFEKDDEISISYSVSASGKSSRCNITIINDSLKNKEYWGILRTAISYDRNTVLISAPVIGLATYGSDNSNKKMWAHSIACEEPLSKIYPNWKPSLASKMKAVSGEVCYIMDESDVSKITQVVENTIKAFQSNNVAKMFDYLLDNQDQYLKQAEDYLIKSYAGVNSKEDLYSDGGPKQWVGAYTAKFMGADFETAMQKSSAKKDIANILN